MYNYSALEGISEKVQRLPVQFLIRYDDTIGVARGAGAPPSSLHVTFFKVKIGLHINRKQFQLCGIHNVCFHR